MPVQVPSRPYKIPVVLSGLTPVTNVQVVAHATKPFVVTRVIIEPAQAALVTDAGARVRLGRKTAVATGTTAIAATTFLNLDPSDADAGLTAGHTATAEGTDGDFIERGYNARAGFDWFPTPEEYILIPAGVTNAFMVKHNVAPPAGSYAFEITVHEIG